EELLRYDSPVHLMRRITLEPFFASGEEIPAGTFVIAGLARPTGIPSSGARTPTNSAWIDRTRIRTFRSAPGCTTVSARRWRGWKPK
ncbi:MAG: hypothetical protein ACRDSH_14385, partial [Pseudonocardiaceae bacterium]